MSQIDTILTLIAQKHLGIETLQTRNADNLDFHDTAVWCIKTRWKRPSKRASNSAHRARRPRKRKSPRTDRRPTKPSRKRLASVPDSAFITSSSTPPRRNSP